MLHVLRSIAHAAGMRNGKPFPYLIEGDVLQVERYCAEIVYGFDEHTNLRFIGH
jgi:hypothetical protein